MEPTIFLDGRVSLFKGDCIEILNAMPENSIDSAVMDPPYHLTSIVERFGKEGAAEAKAGETGAFKRASAGFMNKQWDGGDIAFQIATWEAVKRVLKPGGYILAFASTRGFWRMSVAIEDAGFITHPMIAWVFGSGFPKATRLKAEAMRVGAMAGCLSSRQSSRSIWDRSLSARRLGPLMCLFMEPGPSILMGAE